MSNFLEFPNYYKQCPKCRSKNIIFVEQDIISIKRGYKVTETGEVYTKQYKTTKNTLDDNMAFYGCKDCNWVDFGGDTWNKKTRL